ncbi:sugar ABC transporter substrate-binding protein [bacterium (Candidatus Blackallbacteria) CG17_big_fil_post_rev_8_21_14_2_50_48_46]|uniref:Sugar ABC transporter substrate-binding protein n=1 Tax=bacterium (Candidatus Blackallbacteria) CG17_big_fil_post_rev_8_21_14_2_50_48_46 TaxID=2014261 RepID=A0A2M7GB42_9BACT|nr:MAG: ABC transporter substrate-binding protein [bacterium (Candidatus Blackallbacteria) CG18_big_fil_WC_8_21_14_2_50_49_26]PIW19158.1 MAG: sugar ABC transporter substrate-binding protein [bacterium (Candidatus Blackallbacteria) CG17_big_fil_post_rev_8_21_14_2_50_48_46]PIW45491.1 MAG: sugar ABC transporter substrate-binding protein [bacterium (Candidatus Blackallbacteria) CG13_big_fil_rev_8_21_14_2_50_49_14]
MRKFTSLLLLALGLFSACQHQTSEESLRFSTWGSPEEMAILNPLLKEFQALHPEIKLEVMHIPDKYFQKLHTLIAANLSPDVIFVNNIQFPVYASNQAFLPLEPFLSHSTVLHAEDFYPQTLAGFRWQGSLQGIPRDASNMVIFYNQELFDKAGLAYPRSDWTLEEMLKTAQKLTLDQNRDGHPEQFGISFQNHFLFWTPYLWSAGGDFFSPDQKKAKLETPEAISGIQFHADLRHKYHVAPTSAEAGSSTMSQLFVQGKLAMVVNGRWAVPLYRQNLKFKWDIAPFPQGKAGSIVDADASGWVISRKSKHPEQAWKLIEFLAARKASEAFTQPGLIIPARKDVAQSAVFLAPGKSPASAHYFLKALETGKPTPAIPYWNELLEVLNRSLEPVWDGRASAQDALKGIDQRLEPLL